MNRIETKILNCSAVSEAEKTMVFAARLTQRGHLIHNMKDLIRLYNQSFTNDTIKNMGQLPHPAIQKFAVITVAVVGASRRFLSQITRHQNEVKFMSASLQYSNYSGEADFAIPYEILTAPAAIKELYEKSCRTDMDNYERLCKTGISHDSAGYLTPQGSCGLYGRRTSAYEMPLRPPFPPRTPAHRNPYAQVSGNNLPTHNCLRASLTEQSPTSPLQAHQTTPVHPPRSGTHVRHTWQNGQ